MSVAVLHTYVNINVKGISKDSKRMIHAFAEVFPPDKDCRFMNHVFHVQGSAVYGCPSSGEKSGLFFAVQS